MENEEQTDPNVVGVISEKPVYGRKSGKPVQVGSAVITKYENDTEITMIIGGEDGDLLTQFLVSDMVQGVSIGGVLDKDVAASLNAKNN